MHQAILDYQAGSKLPDILSKHDISKTTLYRWLKEAQISKRGSVRFSPEERSYINREYQNGRTIRSLMEEFGSSHGAIRACLGKVRTTAESIQTFTDDQINKAVEFYRDGLTAKEVGKCLDMSEASVFRFLEERGIKRRKIEYECNDELFGDLNNEWNLYWFGFILADGYVHPKHLSINLGLKDRDHLERFRRHIRYNGPIREVEHYREEWGKLSRHVELRISRKKLVRDLVKHGIWDFKKGGCEALEKLNDEQLRVVLRGFFDGDGSIHLNSRGWFTWYICGPYKRQLEYFMSRCPVVNRHNAIGRPMKYRISYGGNRIVSAICEWLYKDAMIYLPRKKEIYDNSLSEWKKTMSTAIGQVTRALQDALRNFLFSPLREREVVAIKDMTKSILVARYPETDTGKIRITVEPVSRDKVSVSPGNKYTEKLFYKLTIGSKISKG